MAARINPMRSAIIPGHAISRSHPEDLLIQQPNRSYREPTVSQLLSENDVQMKLQHMHHELFQRSSVRSEVVYDDRLQLSGSIPVNHKAVTQSVRPRLAAATRSVAAATRPVAVTARPVATATRPAAQPHISQLPYPPGAFSDAQQPMDFQELNEAERTVMQSVEFEPQSQTVHRVSNSLSFQRDKQRFSHSVSSRLQPSQPAPVSSGGKISISGFRPTQPTRQEPTSRTFIDLTQHVSMQSKETSPCSGMASSDPVALLHGSSRRQHVQPQAIVRDPLQPQHTVRDALQPSGFSMPQSTAPSRDPPTYRRSKSAPADMSPQKARMLRPRTHVRGHNVKCSSYTSKKAKKKMASSSTGTPTYSATGSKEQSEQVTVGEILQATDATDCIGDILKPLSLDESCSSTGRSLATQTDGIMTPGSVLSNGEAIICSQPLTALLASSQKKPKASTSRRKRQLSEECRGALLEGRKFSRITTNVISLSNPDHIKEIRCAKAGTCVCEYSESDPGSACGPTSGCLNIATLVECARNCPSGKHCRNRRFKRGLKNWAKVETKDFGEKGTGVVALEAIPPGAFIAEYVGEVISDDECMRRLGGEYKCYKNFYMLKMESNCIIDATLQGNTARFFNHSCEPNAETQKWHVGGWRRMGIFAKRWIEVGEEISFNYGWQRCGPKKQRCLCGSERCVGFLGDKPKKKAPRASRKEKKDKRKRSSKSKQTGDLTPGSSTPSRPSSSPTPSEESSALPYDAAAVARESAAFLDLLANPLNEARVMKDMRGTGSGSALFLVRNVITGHYVKQAQLMERFGAVLSTLARGGKPNRREKNDAQDRYIRRIRRDQKLAEASLSAPPSIVHKNFSSEIETSREKLPPAPQSTPETRTKSLPDSVLSEQIVSMKLIDPIDEPERKEICVPESEILTAIKPASEYERLLASKEP
eukprot:176752_1